jgi:putative membrane protein
MSDELANDRTLLAWLRTAIASFGLGVIVAKVALIVGTGTKPVKDQLLYGVVGVIIVLCGAVLILIGYSQHRTVRSRLRADQEVARVRWPLTVTVATVLCSLLLSSLLAISA